MTFIRETYCIQPPIYLLGYMENVCHVLASTNALLISNILVSTAVIFTAYTVVFYSSLADAIIYLGSSDGDFYALDSKQLEWEYLGQRNNVGVAMQYLGSTTADERRKDVVVYAGEGADHEVIEVCSVIYDSAIRWTF